MAFIIHFVSALCLLHLSTGQNPECRTLLSVIDSTSGPSHNVAVGGHIWQHIFGLSAKPAGADVNDTQNGKTLFKSGPEFKNAYAAFRGLGGTYQQCPGGGGGIRADHVHANTIGINQAGLCNGVDPQKLCNFVAPYTMTVNHYVTFCYKYVNWQWIMRTAYPRRNGGHPPREQTLAEECEEIFSTEYEHKERDDVISEYKSLIQLLIDWILDL